jgi:hypothetical protein
MVGAAGGGIASFPSGSGLEFFFVCVFGAPFLLAYFGRRAAGVELQNEERRKLIADMRVIATEPLPAEVDPLLKEWDGYHRLFYKATVTYPPDGWPAFADPVKQPVVSGRDARSRPAWVSPDAIDFLKKLDERKLPYLVVGELAMYGHLQDRDVRSVHVIADSAALTALPEVRPVASTNFLMYAEFRQIHVVGYSAGYPFFKWMQNACTGEARIDEMEIRAATVEGLIALDLYAHFVISKYREFYRCEAYEIEIVALVSRFESVSARSVMELLKVDVSEQHRRELESTLENCQDFARRQRRRKWMGRALKGRGTSA